MTFKEYINKILNIKPEDYDPNDPEGKIKTFDRLSYKKRKKINKDFRDFLKYSGSEENEGH